MTVFWRAVSTAIVWLMVIGIIALVSIFLTPELGEDVIVPILFVLVAAVMTNGFIWDWGRGASSADNRKQKQATLTMLDENINTLKRKRRDRSQRLEDYSDTELLDLRERVIAGEIDESELAQLLDR
ncbi:MAG: hypothetical protein WBC91_06330 [Phototrophicaceae bacterium]